MPLVPVPVSGGGRRPCARGLSIHMSLFPYSTVTGARALVDSHDALSVFEATAVDNCVCDRGASSRGPLICVRVLSSCALVRVPLTDTLDNTCLGSYSVYPLDPWVNDRYCVGVVLITYLSTIVPYMPDHGVVRGSDSSIDSYIVPLSCIGLTEQHYYR
jgi:hypothetical protein